ncbi:deoxycytidylate deaminase [Gordonia phage Axym]|uniref:Deoxycytidylate deaminase n=5 Tax=Emalynvirus cozz TaxID=2560490 RepID=A0A4Y5NZ81_9CAUD|nr:deoxycytidylate deaminase [Gordonia phage Cozz]AZS11797.1 deoxycytidylate deaminase [Gordonia phage Nina]QCW22376.1 deoxycytidylate deaminase [Gordonia phage Agatha]QGH75910.1 deoxycytidylate deaminase [Gordonia phage Axym]QOP65302.1 deoxycytidylate deaminase [Gordonia phage Burnsey]ANA85748.1 deoxycytidylate deaminase [Gordonia phage Cozz]
MTERVGREQWLIDLATVISQRSTCSRLHVGAIAVRSGQLLAAGYNGAPAGMPHCVHTDEQPCTRAVHAEVNVIASAARYGASLDGAELYVTHSPCVSCAGLLINAGISKVTFYVPFRDAAGIELLEEAGVTVVVVQPSLPFAFPPRYLMGSPLDQTIWPKDQQPWLGLGVEEPE